MRFEVFYCIYDPDNYRGHKHISVSANSIEDAEETVKDRIRKFVGRGNWEYMIFPSTDHIGPKLIDTRKQDMKYTPFVIVVLGGLVLALYTADKKLERQAIIDQEIMVQSVERY